MEKILPITRNNDFRRAYKRGKSHVSPLLVAYVLKNRLGCTRVGITTSKKIGNAVVRSRARRVLREAYRGLIGRVKPGYDLWTMYAGADGLSFELSLPAHTAVLIRIRRQTR